MTTTTASSLVWSSEERTKSDFEARVFIMYHSTDTPEKAQSIVENGLRKSGAPGNMLGAGIYVSKTMEKAERYGAYTFKLLVYTGKVCRITGQGHPMQSTWQKHYSSAWVPPNCGMVPSGLEVSSSILENLYLTSNGLGTNVTYYQKQY